MVAGGAVKMQMDGKIDLRNEQEILMNVADMLAEVFSMESTVLRTQKQIAVLGEAACESQIDMTRVFVSDALERLNLHGKHALQSFAEGDELRIMLMGLKRFTKYTNMPNVIGLREKIAAKIISENKYAF